MTTPSARGRRVRHVLHARRLTELLEENRFHDEPFLRDYGKGGIAAAEREGKCLHGHASARSYASTVIPAKAGIHKHHASEEDGQRCAFFCTRQRLWIPGSATRPRDDSEGERWCALYVDQITKKS